MRYLLLICGVESSIGVESAMTDPAARRNADDDATKWVEEMDGRGVRKFGNALRATSTATTVRVRDGETLAADGPFAETKEQILGFDLIECDDLDQAIEVAAKHPVGSDRLRCGRSGQTDRRRGRGRVGVPYGLGAHRRSPDPLDRRLGPGRRVRPARLHPCSGALATRRRSPQSERMADDHRAQPCAQPPQAQRDRGHQAAGSRDHDAP